MVLLLLPLSEVLAQYKPQSGSSIIQLGYAGLQPKDIDVDLTGVGVNFTYEHLNLQKFLAYGFSISYLEGSGSNSTGNFKYHTWPITFAMKGFIGGDKARAYVRGQIGIQSSTAQAETTIVTSKIWSTGFTGGGGIGINYLLNERIFLNLEYNANWIESDFYDSELIHLITLGIGIQEK